MAVSASDWAWTVPGLTSHQRLVLTCLANFANSQSGRAWPTTRTIQAATGLSRAAVFRTLAQLRAARLIAQVDRGGRWGNQGVYLVCGKWIKGDGYYVFQWHGDDPATGDWHRIGTTLAANANGEAPPTWTALKASLHLHPVSDRDRGGLSQRRGGYPRETP